MNPEQLPKHVAIIMDGNGRWARARGLARTYGHMEGVKRVEEIIKEARLLGIQSLTMYAFSTENWTRPEDEVSMIMKTFIAVLGQKARELGQNGIKINVIGRREGVPVEVLRSIDEAMRVTEGNAQMILNIAFNYGSRAEILDGVKQIVQEVQEGKLAVDQITEETMKDHLYTRHQVDPDLLIRTSGEIRISNFLLWQLSYAELYFTDKYWPDFTVEEFKKALVEYVRRDRRWGGVRV